MAILAKPTSTLINCVNFVANFSSFTCRDRRQTLTLSAIMTSLYIKPLYPKNQIKIVWIKVVFYLRTTVSTGIVSKRRWNFSHKTLIVSRVVRQAIPSHISSALPVISAINSGYSFTLILRVLSELDEWQNGFKRTLPFGLIGCTDTDTVVVSLSIKYIALYSFRINHNPEKYSRSLSRKLRRQWNKICPVPRCQQHATLCNERNTNRIFCRSLFMWRVFVLQTISTTIVHIESKTMSQRSTHDHILFLVHVYTNSNIFLSRSW